MYPTDDRDLWEQEIADVEPLKNRDAAAQSVHSPPLPPKESSYPSGEDGREIPQPLPVERSQLVIEENSATMIRGGDPSLDKSTREKLRRGQIPIQGVLDLHRKTVQEAAELIRKFLEQSQRENKRCVRIVHGQGEGGFGEIKSRMADLLVEHPAVLAFHSAQGSKGHGGKGALYVLLRRIRKYKK